MTLLGWLSKPNGKPAPGCRSSLSRQNAAVRPLLEQLEDRLALTAFNTITNAAISITPNLVGLSATETITATVTQQGTSTPVTTGNIAFNLNNQTGIAALNSNGQAIFSVTLPLFAVGVNQTLQVNYQGGTAGSDTYNSSVFLAPVYLNLNNEFLPASITYGTSTSSTSSQSSSSETDALSYLGFPIQFIYGDTGRIQSIGWGAYTLPGSYAIFFGVPQFG